jgi:hypothetical protein
VKRTGRLALNSAIGRIARVLEEAGSAAVQLTARPAFAIDNGHRLRMAIKGIQNFFRSGGVQVCIQL